MRLSPVLLRLLLMLALLANGVTGAFATTHMQVAHVAEMAAETKTVAAAHADAAKPPCHEHMPAMDDSEAASQITPPSAALDTDSGTEHGSPDCCQSANCACACMQHMAATSASVHMLQVRIDHASGVRPLKMGHATPALPQLIRPPIG
jgi:hypothetical protein